jgi:G:T-mismatch repair DNA endonuclease (very short patch repair protein)
MNAFWRAKIERNIQRDRQVDRALRRQGWSVLRFGEVRIKTRPLSVVQKIKSKLEEYGGVLAEVVDRESKQKQPGLSTRPRKLSTTDA